MHNAANTGLPENGTSSVAPATASAPNRIARRRASVTAPDNFIDTAPPNNPPNAPTNGGIHASVRFTTPASIPHAETKYGVVQFDHKLYTDMINIAATINPQYARDRNSSDTANTLRPGSNGCTGVRRATAHHTGTHTNPNAPATKNAARHPYRGSMYPASNGAAIIPIESPTWLIACPNARSRGSK